MTRLSGYKIWCLMAAYNSFLLCGQMPINIVPNSSFNLIETCPAMGPVHNFNDYYCWLPKNESVDSGMAEFGSPNPFHSCNGYYSENCTPNDLDGGGGVGMGINYNTPLQYREFSAIKLTQTLKAYQNYCLSFYLANCSSIVGTGSSDLYFLNKQMIGFSSQPFPWENNNLSDYMPHLNIGLQNEIIFTDTAVWHKIQGNYIANGFEEYLFLGWAESASNISIVIIDDVPGVDYGAAYYLFDSISVVECDEMGMNIDNLEVPNVITPNNDGVNDFWILNNGETIPNNICIEIYNIWGALVYHSSPYNNEWYGQNQCGNDLSEGVYYYVIHLPVNQQKSGTVNIFR